MPPETGPPETGEAAHLWDMLDAARAVQRFIENRDLEDYRADEQLRAAVERKIEIIGEAARRLSESFQQQHRHVPWRKIMAQRHVLAHEYGEIDDALIWRVATIHIPELIVMLDPLVPPSPAE
jgi:uncharacterized protein with HEPN domain